jgi:hypothetical protein
VKELFEFILEWPKQQKKAGEVYGGVFVLISLSGFRSDGPIWEDVGYYVGELGR